MEKKWWRKCPSSEGRSVPVEIQIWAQLSGVLIIIQVFLKCKMLSLETVLSACACTHAHTHTHTHTHTHAQRHPHTQAFWLYKAKFTQLKTGSKHVGDLEWIKTSARNRRHGRSTILGKEMLLDYIWMSPERFCRRGRGRSFHVDGPENRKCVGTNSGESGVRNLLFRNLLHATSISTPVPSLWLKT